MFELDDEPQPRPSIADDPSFLASLAHIDGELGTRSRDEWPPAADASAESTRWADAPLPPIVPRRSRDAFDEGAANPPFDAFYGLDDNPFAADPDARFLYHGTSHDRAALDIVAAVVRHDPVIVVTGADGVGKTMLCRTIVQELDRRTLTSSVIEPPDSLDALLRTVLADFGVVSRDDHASGRLAGATRAELTTALKEFVASLAVLQAAAVVLIDQAERLSVDTLAALGGLHDALGESPLLHVVLVGRPALLTAINQPELAMLSDRAATRLTLEPLLHDEIAGFVSYRLRVAGRSARVEFSERTFEAVFAVSQGNPRVVNQVCERALELGREASASVIGTHIVAAAAESLGLEGLPRSRASSSIQPVLMGIGFGLLVLAGAAAAVWVLQDDFLRVLAGWNVLRQH